MLFLWKAIYFALQAEVKFAEAPSLSWGERGEGEAEGVAVMG
jgi:hypothetical protein